MEFVAAGCAGACAALFSNPMEVVKVRMQLQGELYAWGNHEIHYKNAFHAAYVIIKHDGLLSLQAGLVSALWYQQLLNGLRLGFFQTMEDYGYLRNEKGELLFFRSVLTAGAGGAFASVLTSPLYLIKTQMQAKTGSQLAFGYQHEHPSMLGGLINIYKNNGMKGLYRGTTTIIPRSFAGCSSQLISFTVTKDFLKKRNWDDGLLTSFASSMVGGLVVSVVLTPFDLIATRIFNQGTDTCGKGILYQGYFDCIIKIFRSEGLYGFYKGLGASYFRLGPHTVLSFVFWDLFRDILNLNRQEKGH